MDPFLLFIIGCNMYIGYMLLYSYLIKIYKKICLCGLYGGNIGRYSIYQWFSVFFYVYGGECSVIVGGEGIEGEAPAPQQNFFETAYSQSATPTIWQISQLFSLRISGSYA